MNERAKTQNFYIKILLLTALTILLVVPVFVFTASYSHAAQNIVDGDLVTVFSNPDIYIIKIVGVKKFKRLILNPDIFNSYGHLKWSNVKTIDQATIDLYKLSELVIEINSDGSVADPKVYRVVSSVNSDIGERSWLNLTASEFETAGYDWDSLFHVNHKEALPDFYPTKNPLTYQDVENIKKASSSQLNVPTIQNIDTSSPRYLTTEGGAVYDTVLKQFISPATSSSTPTTTQPSTVVVESINLSASPATIPADGKSTSIITATVKDVSNNAVPNQTVYFSYGNIIVAAVTSASGSANMTYTADTTAGATSITANVGVIKNTVQIIKRGPAVLFSQGSVYGKMINGNPVIYLGPIFADTSIKNLLVYKGISKYPDGNCLSTPCWNFTDPIMSPTLTKLDSSNTCYSSYCGQNLFTYTATFNNDFFGNDQHVVLWIDVVFEAGDKIGLINNPDGLGLFKSVVFQ